MSRRVSSVVTVAGKPVPKGRPRFNPQTRRVSTPRGTRVHERRIAWALVEAGWKGLYPAPCRLVVSCDFYGAHHSADVDNLAKAVLDAMQMAGVFDNDRQVETVNATNHRGGPGYAPARTEIRCELAAGSPSPAHPSHSEGA